MIKKPSKKVVLVESEDEDASDSDVTSEIESSEDEAYEEVEVSSEEETQANVTGKGSSNSGARNEIESSEEEEDEEEDESEEEEEEEETQANEAGIRSSKSGAINEMEGADDEEDESSSEEETQANGAGKSNVEDLDDDIGNDDTDALTNAGWADAISKILGTNQPKRKRTLVLSRAKIITELKKDTAKPAGFEVAKADGNIETEFIKEETIEEKPKTTVPRKRKRDILSLRVKPNILEKDRERILSKIATKGVVQLFNSVRLQQKDIDTKLKGAKTTAKKDKVLENVDKSAFMDVLMSKKSQSVKNKTETDTENTWNVFRDDFMMRTKLKDWDKKEAQTEEMEVEYD